MRKLVVLLAIFVVLSAIPAFPAAESQKQATPERALSEEDTAKLRANVRALAEAFGLQPPQAQGQQAQEQQKKPAESTTMAKVADKALDMVNSLVASAAVTLNKVAPEVWRIMIRQQYANAISGPLLPFGILVLAGLWCYITKRMWPKPQPPDSPPEKASDIEMQEYKVRYSSYQDLRGTRFVFTSIIPFAALCFFGTWLVIEMRDSIKILINPQYYAFRDLLNILLRGGQL